MSCCFRNALAKTIQRDICPVPTENYIPWVRHGVPINRKLAEMARAIEEKDRRSELVGRLTAAG